MGGPLADEGPEEVGRKLYTPSMLAGASSGLVSRIIGLGGLYKGIGVAAVGSCPAACLYFAGYEMSRDFLRKRKELEQAPFAADFLAGVIAEAISCVLWVPIDVAKERLQVQSTLQGATVYRSSSHAVQTIFKQEGLAGIYKGYFATLASFGPFSGLYFVFYEQLKRFTMNVSNIQREGDLSALQSLGNGAGAGAMAGLLTNGLDMAKLRLQVQGQEPSIKGAFRYRNFGSALMHIIRTEGVLALFKGAGARILFFVPSQAISMTLFERFKSFYRDVLFPEEQRYMMS